MSELIAYRDTLMRELDSGYFDLEAWEAGAIWAGMIECDCIKAQLERYIAHYAGVVNR